MRASSKAFTLIEVLVTVAIIAILATVAMITINPAQLIAQSRDSNRISDVRNLYGTISFYKSDQMGSSQFSLGSSSVVYVSLPDPAATTAAGSNCASLNLPMLPSPYSYHCAGPNYYRKTDGTGWIPVNLTSASTGSPLGILPIDPTNASSSRLYYTYTTNGSQFEFTAAMESTKYKLGGSNDQVSGDGGLLASVYEKGTQLGLEPLDYGDTSLVGYWPMNEGSGNVAYDYSGNNATGTWSGAQTGTNGTHYSPGKVGPWAGTFDGNNDYVNIGSLGSFPTQGTISFWMNATVLANYPNALTTYYNGGNTSIRFEQSGSNFYSYDGINQNYFTTGLAENTWYFITFTWNVSINNETAYFNGNKVSSSGGSFPATIPDFVIGEGFNTSRYWNGLIDDVRVYNRALSATEIQAMYNAGK
jgi:prepilin-type N-terminal cleavage/methylation domain-containing protein